MARTNVLLADVAFESFVEAVFVEAVITALV